MYKERQAYLKSASEQMINGQAVQVAIQPEPENDNDQNGISVLLEYGFRWKKVGYIPDELTCYLHPLINNGSIQVTIPTSTSEQLIFW